MIRWIHVNSKAISDLAYQPDTLFIKFIDGTAYAYYHVPYNIYSDFIHAPSKGRFFQKNILKRFEYQKM